MMCLNCGSRPRMFMSLICKECLEIGKRQEQILKDGLVIEYTDGSKVTLTSKQVGSEV